MKKEIIISLLILFNSSIVKCQDYKIELITSYWSDTLSRPEIKPILEVYKNYLESNPDSIYDNPYWNSREKALYHDFDFSRNSIFGGKGGWTPKTLYTRFKPHILKVEKRDSSYMIQSLLYWDKADSTWLNFNPIAITRYYIVKENDEWKLANAIFYDTKDWSESKSQYINYYYKDKDLYNPALALKGDHFCDSLIARFEFKKPNPISFYIVDGIHEVGRLLGYDHYIYGFAWGKSIENIVISGDFEANFLHELVHQLMPVNSNRHRLVNEGIPVWMAGSMGKSFQELSKEWATAYLNLDSSSWFSAMECRINCYPFYGIVIDLIHERAGDEGIKQLINDNTENEEKLFESIFRITGWNKEEFMRRFDEKVKNTANKT